MNNEQTHILDTPEQIENFRHFTILQGLELELLGMKMSRGRSCYAIAKQEFCLKGNKQKVRDQLAKILGRE
jgi:hypothetical protein